MTKRYPPGFFRQIWVAVDPPLYYISFEPCTNLVLPKFLEMAAEGGSDQVSLWVTTHLMIRDYNGNRSINQETQFTCYVVDRSQGIQSVLFFQISMILGCDVNDIKMLLFMQNGHYMAKSKITKSEHLFNEDKIFGIPEDSDMEYDSYGLQ